MFDARDLLGAMLGSGMGGRNPRMGSLGGGGLGGMLGSGMGGVLSSGGMMGGLAGRRMGGGGLQGALLGVLGGIAANALQRRLQESSSTPSASLQPAADQASTSGPASGCGPARRDWKIAGDLGGRGCRLRRPGRGPG